jgi:transposase
MKQKKYLNYQNNNHQNVEDRHGQKKLITYREKVNHLYFEAGLSKREIINKVSMSSHFVIKWTQSPEQDMTEDHRGWKQGDRRKWTQETEDRIKQFHQKLSDSEQEFFTGATAVSQMWLKEYNDVPPPLRTIGQIMKDLGLSTHPRGKSKGAAKYLLYPETTIYGGYLGNRVMEADFIQRRYIRGNGTPLNFIGFSAKKDPKFRYYRRIEDLTVDNFIDACDEFLSKFDKPDVLKLDNASTFRGSVSAKRTLSRVILYLLQKQIIPVFAVPRKPFSQGSIEGNNSVFSRYFWKRREFKNLEDLDCQLGYFNAASLRYSGYEKPEQNPERKPFIPKVCFLRQIHESDTHPGKGMIDVLNEEILLPADWINFFVLAEWNLNSQNLVVYLEENETLKTLADIKFNINETTKSKLKNTVALSFCQ